MTPDELALYRAVAVAPADDTPRLVLADFLDERAGPGDAAQAEYLRLECERPRLTHRHYSGAPSCRACKLKRAAEKLLRAHGTGWRAKAVEAVVGEGLPVPLPPGTAYRDGLSFGAVATAIESGGFERGMVAAILLHADDWAAHGDRILRALPVTEVVLPPLPRGRWIGGQGWAGRWPGVTFRTPRE